MSLALRNSSFSWQYWCSGVVVLKNGPGNVTAEQWQCDRNNLGGGPEPGVYRAVADL